MEGGQAGQRLNMIFTQLLDPTKEARKTMSKEQRKAEHLATKAKVDNILNNEQGAKMSEIRKKRREYRKN
jgi:Spy/CpxP family protein refolding chaperone